MYTCRPNQPRCPQAGVASRTDLFRAVLYVMLKSATLSCQPDETSSPSACVAFADRSDQSKRRSSVSFPRAGPSAPSVPFSGEKNERAGSEKT
jgi:hypothetical protein